MAKVIGIIGTRRRDTEDDIVVTTNAFLRVHKAGDTIVSGGCPQGGDRFAERTARAFAIPIKIHPAEWTKYGRSAGFKRNQYIADDATVLIACVAPTRMGGTEDTIRKYLRKLALSETQAIQQGLLILV